MNMQDITINVFNIVGNSLCVEADDGQKVFTAAKKVLSEGKKIVLSFQNVKMITTAFLNTAVGQLYRDFPEELIKQSLSVSDMSDDDKVQLKRVTATAKIFYKDPERMQNSINEILEED
jgi:Icc-related predicted phosphoesterase